MRGRKAVATNIPIVRRKGRKLVGVTEDHFKRMSKQRKTTAGMLAISAVASTCIEIGLKQLESTGLNIREDE